MAKVKLWLLCKYQFIKYLKQYFDFYVNENEDISYVPKVFINIQFFYHIKYCIIKKDAKLGINLFFKELDALSGGN